MERENNKTKFSLYWLTGIFVLLLMIGFGLSSSVKGTKANSECSSGYVNEDGECINSSACIGGYVNEDGECIDTNTTTCFKCNDSYNWGKVTDNPGCTLKNEYTTKATCLVNNTNGYGCFLKNSQTSPASIYEWTNNGSIITSPSYYYYDNYDTEAKCLSNNKCYSNSGKYYWGSVYNPSGNGYTLASNYTTEDACLANNKTEPMITVEPSSLSVMQGKTVTFTVKSNVVGKFDIVSKDTAIAIVSSSSVTVAENEVKTITVTGVKAGGPVEIVLTFTPDESTLYNTKNETISVTVNKVTSSGDYDPEPTQYTYTATFNAGSGATLNGKEVLTCTSYLTNLCTLDSSYSIPTATKSGHSFTGWDISTSCSSPLKNNLKMTSRNVTYHACFTANSNSVDKDGNVTTNSPTGDIVIGVIWFAGIFAIAYFIVNYRRIKDN